MISTTNYCCHVTNGTNERLLSRSKSNRVWLLLADFRCSYLTNHIYQIIAMHQSALDSQKPARSAEKRAAAKLLLVFAYLWLDVCLYICSDWNNRKRFSSRIVCHTVGRPSWRFTLFTKRRKLFLEAREVSHFLFDQYPGAGCSKRD